MRDVVCSQAYERNVEQERSRRAGVEALEDARQKWRYSNRIQVKERRDMAERYRRTGKLDAQLSVGDIPATFSAVLLAEPATDHASEMPAVLLMINKSFVPQDTVRLRLWT